MSITRMSKDNRHQETTHQQEEGSEDLRTILNQKRKGKKVIFANNPSTDNNGTTEVTTGKMIVAPSMFNVENQHVPGLDTSNRAFTNIAAVGVNASNVVAGIEAVANIPAGTVVDDAAVHDKQVHVNTHLESNIPTFEDDFNYDDPIITALLDKNWDEEIQSRHNRNDIIADIEAINDIFEINALKNPC
ncbi:hypothetical protein Salat_2431700 [Sesamum alatum]|uniref:Uncharacterized protein n=1 Tax=Sesamum alatum TaxID=300844 RepID=A0AAE1XY12_9LAMI|nr:hypothetical protein Salat_2431700 [Sesamum alatum]